MRMRRALTQVGKTAMLDKDTVQNMHGVGCYSAHHGDGDPVNGEASRHEEPGPISTPDQASAFLWHILRNAVPQHGAASWPVLALQRRAA